MLEDLGAASIPSPHLRWLLLDCRTRKSRMAGWKDTLRKVAPALGPAHEAIPVAGPALAAVSKALLGCPDGTEDEVAARIANW